MNFFLPYDPVPWLMAQDARAAVRARRLLGLHHEGDEETVRSVECELSESQLSDGTFEHSLIKTAGVLNLLDDLKPYNSKTMIKNAASYLLDFLESQPGYNEGRDVTPGSLETPCDLCGFFGPYENRNLPETLASGAREMNFFREFEPLLGPKSKVRAKRKSSFDRVGPSSCYSWGLIPLCYAIEALCRAGYEEDPKIKPPVNVLLGAQRASGGWCRNLGGAPNCTIHAIKALAVHPQLRDSLYAEKALQLLQNLRKSQNRWWRGSNVFAAIQAIAEFEFPISKEILFEELKILALRQQKNGTWGGPCRNERVTAVLYALQHLKEEPK